MVTDRLFRRLRKLIRAEDTLAEAADRAGVDEKTVRKYRDSGPLRRRGSAGTPDGGTDPVKKFNSCRS
jgi:hypothetical protein